MFNQPRTWKYMVPGVAAVGFFLIAAKAYLEMPSNKNAPYIMLFAGAVALLCLVATITNWWRLVSDHYHDLEERHYAALAMTPLVMLSNNLKQMHPEAVKVLNRFGVRTSWQVNIRNFGERDWILLDTNCHLGFVEYVLDRSSTALMPKRRLAEGSKKWDPDGIVTDRQQYDEFEKWLFVRMMVTRSHGEFAPAEFIPPWTPAKIKEVMGMVGEQELYEPIEAAAKDLNGNGSGQKVENGKQKAVNNTQQTPIDDRPVDDAELAAIAMENQLYAGKFDA